MAFSRQNGLLLFRVSHLKLLDKLTVFCRNHLTPGRIKNDEKESHPKSNGFVNMNIKKNFNTRLRYTKTLIIYNCPLRISYHAIHNSSQKLPRKIIYIDTSMKK